MLLKLVARVLLIYGSEILVVTVSMLKVLEGFHQRAFRRIAGMMEKRAEDRDWEYPPVADAIEEAGLWPIKEYIQRRSPP